MDLFKLLGTIIINNSDANKALEETGETAEKTKGRLSNAFSAVGKGAVTVGKWVGTGLAAGGAAMGALTIKAMNLGGELEQNMGGSEAVFKEYANKMQETAKNAFSNMGLSTSDFLGTANKMSALFQGAGFSIEESSNLASDSMQRAADVASIMGIDTASAMEAIAGAAKGNFTMMDNLGVAMNDTTLNAYALEKGIGKTTQEMTNQEKIALAMEMFMEKTSYAAGNYAKENETLAGSLGTAKAALTNFLDGSGDVESLVTAFSNTAQVIIKNLGEIAPRLVSGISEIINQVMPMLPPLLNQLLPIIIEGAINLIDGLVSAMPMIIDGIMAALPMIIEGFEQIINSLIKALPMLIQSLVSALPTLIPMLIDALVSIIVTICSQFNKIIQPIIDELPDIIISLVDAIMDNLPILIEGLITLTLGIVQAIPQIIQALVDAMPYVIESIITGLFNLLPVLIMGFIDLIKGVADAKESIFGSLKEAFINYYKGIWKGITNVFANIGDWFGKLFSGAKDRAVNAWSDFKGKMSEKWTAVKNVFSNVGGWFSEKFSDAWNRVKNIFSNVGSFFSGIWDKIKNAFSAIGTKIADSISGAVKKGINGLIGSAENIINGFFKLINGAIDMINKIPKVNISKIKMVEFTRLAKGGVVDSPTPAIFGEDGAEAVVPLENNTGWINKVALKLHDSIMQFKGGLDTNISIRSVELQQMQVSELQTLNGTVNKLLAAVLMMDKNMGGHLREALDGVSFEVNHREFARLVKGVN